MTDYLLGLDAGNTVIKAILFDTTGRELAVAALDGQSSMPAPGQVERDLDELWRNAITVIRTCIEKSGVNARDIRAVGCAGHGNGLYALDRAGKPLLGIQSLDTRAAGLAAEWHASDVGDHALAIARQKPWGAQTPTLLAWIKRHRPDLYAEIGTVLLCKDFVVGRLTGARVTDTTDMSGCGLLAIPSRRYSVELLAAYGLEDAMPLLPDVLESSDIAGHVTEDVAALTGLAAGTPVVAGLFDVVASAVGSGVTATGAASIIAGTWSINQVICDAPVDDDRVFMQSSFDRSRWLAIESSATSAANLEWIVHQFMHNEDKPFDRAGELVASVDAAADVPIYHPYLYGAPWDGNARAGFYGIAGWHSKAHLMRALFEGVAFGHRGHVEVLQRAGIGIRDVTLSGGGSRSAVWPQMFADILELPVTVARGRETGALGAAIAAATGVGLFHDYAEGARAMTAPARQFAPDRESGSHYARRYGLYEQLARAMQPVWAEMGRQ
ncbi:xylulose kinase [Devosia sp. Root413D1]|uniref:FGGY-family carbohydrate kinase n=1 Tax=Devosia sp. Root413D1 TaxID=1736531 RepID=UPI0006FEB5CB|nr:FGGY-family carbohydrate kinase [Devosia sp. Root413D1]KQW86107.1 xylulose kinase [Devosia sp. Root413D1]